MPFQHVLFMKTPRFLLLFFFIFASASASATNCNHLLIEPQAGIHPIINSIQHAKRNIELVIYGFTRRDLRRALIKAKKRGVAVQVILEKNPYKHAQENDYTRQRLIAAGIKVHNGNSHVALTHQKSLVIDHHLAWIMTMNFTYSGFKKQRNFAWSTCNSHLLTEMNSVFYQDWQDKDIREFPAQLVWSPINARQRLTQLINSAKQQIDIYALSLADYQLIGYIARQAARGIDVRVILPSKDSKLSRSEKRYLRSHGVKLHFMHQLSQHAKVIIIDGKSIYLGSTNLTEASIDKNRELGIIISDHKLAKKLTRQFNLDYSN